MVSRAYIVFQIVLILYHFYAINTKACGEGPVVNVCTDDKEVNVNQVFLDTSLEPKYQLNMCKCDITNVTAPQDISHSATVEFQQKYYDNDQLFEFDDGLVKIKRNSKATLIILHTELPILYTNGYTTMVTPEACVKLTANSGIKMTVECKAQRKESITTERPSTNRTLAPPRSNYNVRIAVGIGVGLLALVTAVIVVLFCVRKYKRKSKADDSLEDIVENPLYNHEGEELENGKLSPNSNCASRSNHANTVISIHQYASISEAPNTTNEEHYSEPQDVSHNPTYVSGTYDYVSNQERTLISKHDHNDSNAASLDIASGTNHIGGQTIIDKKTTVKENENNCIPGENQDTVYDKTTDKQNIIPVNEYTHFGMIAKGITDPLNAYDTTEHVVNTKFKQCELDNCCYDTTIL